MHSTNVTRRIRQLRPVLLAVITVTRSGRGASTAADEEIARDAIAARCRHPVGAKDLMP